MKSIKGFASPQDLEVIEEGTRSVKITLKSVWQPVNDMGSNWFRKN